MSYNLEGLSSICEFAHIPKKCDSYEIIFDIKFSICEEKSVVYNNDGTFNRVRISENIFVNVCKDDLDKTMVSILNRKVGDAFTHVESGQKICIGKDLPGEYVYSRSSRSLTIYKKYIKGIIIKNLEELIIYSSKKTYEINHKLKHIVDAKYGFYRYKVNFSISLDEKEEFYEAVVLIRNDADGKKYLYDILGIKKLID